ncbi:MAG: ribbon-helix-helix domain-containing protein [Rhodospirillales bacterium]|nr:ribbon-helix-helix domain-containing protein [Rhodospirillales bacterium]
MTVLKNSLISKNVTVNGRRTSIRLERASWLALDDICRFENLTLHVLCSMIEQQRQGSSRTSAVRAFIVSYFRKAAIDAGAFSESNKQPLLSQIKIHSG